MSKLSALVMLALAGSVAGFVVPQEQATQLRTAKPDGSLAHPFINARPAPLGNNGKGNGNDDEENWPDDGPWLVIVATDVDNVAVSNKASQKATAAKGKKGGSAKDYKLKYNLAADHLLAVDGVSLTDLLSIEGVIDVKPDLPVYAATTWGIDRIDQNDLPLDGTYAPYYSACGASVYVIDTGLDVNHQEFSDTGNGRTVQNIFNSHGALSTNTDDHGHGTHCAGTVGGKTIGVSPCANIYGLKVLSAAGSGSTSDIIAAIDHVMVHHQATPGSHSVISMSLGGSCRRKGCDDPMSNKIAAAAALGIVTAAAAGNDGADAKYSSPSNAPEAISVVAADSTDTIAYFSNYGSTVDISAPGVDITSACSSHDTNPDCHGGDDYVTWSGTSMACPHVAGVLAQILANFPYTTAADARSLLYGMAAKDKLLGASADTVRDMLQAPKYSGPPVFAPTAEPTLSSPPVAAVASDAPQFAPTLMPVTTADPCVPGQKGGWKNC